MRLLEAALRQLASSQRRLADCLPSYSRICLPRLETSLWLSDDWMRRLVAPLVRRAAAPSAASTLTDRHDLPGLAFELADTAAVGALRRRIGDELSRGGFAVARFHTPAIASPRPI
ncbi:unnamed protein product [Protopolystoma xenopodis]|uniref:Uncharacterized protein n=1 Tax=Protopolystoma xenopodis TaxID=117903 RepID=A0A448X9S3_9PLAT|nr:unnamed protein product [Protopolystoma xenopodis]